MLKFLQTDFTNKYLSEGNESIVIEGYANRYADTQGQILIDRDGDAILPSGYDVSNFLKNPIILAYHDRGRPIGKSIEIKVLESGLYIKAEIFKDLDPVVFSAVERGILSQFSIGFITKKARYDPESEIYFFSEVELLEVSIVSIPANADSAFSLVKSACSEGSCVFSAKEHKGATPEVTPAVVPEVTPAVVPEVTPAVAPIDLPAIIAYLETTRFTADDFGGLLIVSSHLSNSVNTLLAE